MITEIKNFEKKTILITEAGSGLGKGTAIGLAKEGHKILLQSILDLETDVLYQGTKENCFRKEVLIPF